MKTQHTPGPWNRNIAPATKYCVIFAGRNEHIASIRHCKEGDEAEANHNLITAAPDLLAALEACLTDDGAAAERSHTMACRRLAAINEICRAAIAKARGEA